MAIYATNTGIKRELIPAGNYIGRCYQMIHIGTVQESYMGEPKQFNKVRIGWELPTERRVFREENGEQPFVISKEFTLSMNEKSNLRKMLASWRGKDFSEDEAKKFDITKLLGIPCMINIIHKPKATDPTTVYEQIASVTPIPKGMNVPEQENKNMVLSYDGFDWAVFEALPDFIKDKIKGSIEFAKMQEPNHVSNNEPVDDLPF
jgi:hypothetical protein